MKISQATRKFISVVIIGGAIFITYQQYVTLTGDKLVNECVSGLLERKLDFPYRSLTKGVVGCEYYLYPRLWWGTLSYVVFLLGLVFVPGVIGKKEKNT